MAAAYATLANGGTAIEPTTIDEVRLRNGEVLTADQEETQGVIAPGNAYILTKTLQQVIERGTGTAADIGRPAAGKTGTTDDYADAWFVGYTPQLATAVWVGYPQGRISMTNVRGITVFGGTFPAAIWRNFMAAAHRGRPVRPFALPSEEIVTVKIDPETGLLAAPWCPGVKRRMLRQFAPTETCPLPVSETPDLGTSDPRNDDRTPSPSPTETEGSRGNEGRGGDDGGEPTPSPEPEPTKTKP
jgi:penicillin-binding protein 1A